MTATQTATTDAVELKAADFSVHSAEEATHAPVLLLHGLLGSKRNFASLGKALAGQLQQKRQVLAVDLRNHGDNHHDWRDSMSLEEMAMDVVAYMDRQGHDKCVLVAHSIGGKVAQTLALLYPERVEGLVVLDIAPVTYCPEEDVA